MSEIQGIAVRLKTSDREWAGTDYILYIGIVGRGGGREFPLKVPEIDDFVAGTDVTYQFGTVWEAAAVAGAKRPFSSGGRSEGRWNDPTLDRIELDLVDYVYLRIQSEVQTLLRQLQRDTGGHWQVTAAGLTPLLDDYAMAELVVTLHGPEPNKRIFRTTQEVGLGWQYGLQVWLREEPVRPVVDLP